MVPGVTADAAFRAINGRHIIVTQSAAKYRNERISAVVLYRSIEWRDLTSSMAMCDLNPSFQGDAPVYTRGSWKSFCESVAVC